jgi:hypothetical protein
MEEAKLEWHSCCCTTVFSSQSLSFGICVTTTAGGC